MLIGKTVIAPPPKKHKHEWKKTQRNIPGAILYFNGCEGCQKLKAYDMKITSYGHLKGWSEYENRSY